MKPRYFLATVALASVTLIVIAWLGVSDDALRLVGGSGCMVAMLGGFIDIAQAVWNGSVAAASRSTSVTHVGGLTTYVGNQVAGMLTVDADYIRGGQIPLPNITGVPRVDITHVNGSAAPDSAGTLSVNITKVNGSAAPNDVGGYLNVNTVYHRASVENVLQSGRRDVYVGAMAAGCGWHVTNNQHFTTTASGATTANTTISSVTTARAVPHFNGDSPSGTTGAENEHAYIELTTSTNVRLTRNTTNDSTTTACTVEDAA